MKTENKRFEKVYNSDASRFKGKSQGVFFPESIEDVQKTVKENKHIVVRGGGTGLAGGATPQDGKDIVLDLSKLDKIENLDSTRKEVEVEAGVILDELQEYAEKYNLEFPVNPSSHSVATIGGMIATNAVGSRAIKYGKTSNWIKWVDVVDGHGNISRKGITEISDYAGLEGITGVVVKACIKLSEKKIRTASLLSLNSIGEVIEKTKELKRDPTVSMIEYMDKLVSRGIGIGEKYHLLVEYENDDGILKEMEYKELLSLRDKVYPFLASSGFSRIEDPKIPIDKTDLLLKFLEEKCIPVFGHISVGILHPCLNEDQQKYLPQMMEIVRRNSGQISGEHGIGLIKKPFVEANDKKIFINIKKRTDPLNKFNAGKVV
jgi:FAD/FMN-containing dehydrogenase